MSTAQTLSELKALRDLLLSGWCQHSYAQNGQHNDCGLDDPKRSSYCLVGALCELSASPEVNDLLASQIPGRSTNHNGILSLLVFNDMSTTTHVDVIALIDRAIEQIGQ